MKNTINLFVIVLLMISCTAQEKDANDQWERIFNGASLEGWTIKISGHPLGENYYDTFVIEDSVLKVNYDNYKSFNGEFGHIFYNEELSSYRLRLKYRFTGEQVSGGPGWAYRNSGVMLHSQSPESMLLNQDFPVSVEAQFLGGDGHSERSTLNLCTPGTNVTIDKKLITRHCTNSSSKTYHGDIWVETELVVYSDSIIHHIVNGDTVMSYNSPQIGGGSIPEGFPLQEGTALKSGYISLQAESHPVEFKDIELMRIE